MIHEIANANNIPHDVAVLKFLNDLAEKPVLGYVAKLNVLKSLVEKKESDLITLSLSLDQKKDMAKLLPLLISTRNQDKINDPPSSLQPTPNYVQNEMAGPAVHVSTNRLAEDPNQNKELAREHVGSEAAAIWNPLPSACRIVSLELCHRTRRAGNARITLLR